MTQEPSIPLLATKLYVPPRRPNGVPRPRLLARLDEGLRLQRPLTLVSAKAGSGKTTLASEWLHGGERRAAWISLDANDSERRRFLGYLEAALGGLGIEVGWPAAAQDLSPEGAAVELINEAAAVEEPLILLLDDYHYIADDWIHQFVGFVAEHAPPELHLAIVTRVDPPLPLARLRARGQMTEIRDHDLRFTAHEAGCFLNQVMDLDLPPEGVAALERRTEGWIAGLQMASLAVQARRAQGQGDAAAFVEAFGGAHRFVLDYLLEEVLDRQPPEVQDFLIESSILERMCGDLCDALRSDGGAGGSQAILAQLERRNLFVAALDGERRWYRFHPLFADLLESTLRTRRSELEIRELYRRASLWHQDRGSLEEAMRYAMAAQDYERAASMVERRFTSIFARSEVPLLLGWIEQLPPEVVRRHPWIDVHRATTLVLAGRLEGVKELLGGIEARLDPDDPQCSELRGHMAAVRAYAANLRGDASQVVEMAALTRRCLPGERLTARGMAAYALADAHLAGDDVESAAGALLDMFQSGEKAGQLIVIVPALCDLAGVRRVQGRLCQAQDLYDQAWEWMAERNALGSRVRCAYEFGLADLLRERNQLDAAYQHATTGLDYRRRLGGYWVVGDLPVMRILQARGDAEGALRVLHEAERVVDSYHFQMAGLIAFRTARVRQWLAVGDVERADLWAQACRGGSELEQIALARLDLAKGRAAGALRLLGGQRVRAEAGGRTGRLIEILALEALALRALDRAPEAEAALYRALSLARPEGYVRLFVDLGQDMRPLLGRLAAARGQGGDAARLVRSYARDLLGAYADGRAAGEGRSSPGAERVEALTEREREVLGLLAEGLSNKGIADRLVVAPSTIKQHLKNIYGKLDVHSRTEAVAKGQRAGLI